MERYIDDFFLDELRKDGFNRYDIIVRLLAVEEYMKQNRNGFYLYDKMQYHRLIEKPYINKDGNTDYHKKFVSLIDSFNKNGYVKCYDKVCLNKYGNLIDGSHRIALALFGGFDYLECDYSDDLREYNDNIYYGKGWFESHFKAEECDIIYKRYERLLAERGRLAYAVIWPLGIEHLSVIEEYLKKYFNVISYNDIMFDSFMETKLFVELIYSHDCYREDRAIEKIDTFVSCKAKYIIRFYKVKYFQDTYEDCLDKDIDFIVQAKGEIRKNLNKEIMGYVYDNMFHCGQTISENQFLQLLYETR